MFRLTYFILTVMAICCSSSSQAVTIQLLYRPSFSMLWRSFREGTLTADREAILSQLEESPESLGHVAIFLPGDGKHEPQIVGWEPKASNFPAQHPLHSSRKAAYDWILRNATKGEFHDNALWALAGMRSPHTKTMSLSLEVTDTDLLKIRHRIKQMNEGPQYYFQLISDNQPGAKPFHFNCVGAITYLLRVTSIPPQFFPSQTACFEDFIYELGDIIRPWRSCGDFIAGGSNDLRN